MSFYNELEVLAIGEVVLEVDKMKDVVYFENKIERALLREHVSRSVLNRINDEIEDSSLTKDGYFYYLLGYLKFHLPNRSLEETLMTKKLFEKSIELDRKNPFTLYYLSFVFYDSMEYARAFETFSRIDNNYFVEIDLKWRAHKVNEMIYCCQLSLSDNEKEFCGIISTAADFFIDLIIDENEENFNYPVDLISCIYRVVIKEKFNCKSINKICDLMKALELDEHYHLEFKQFQDSLTNY